MGTLNGNYTLLEGDVGMYPEGELSAYEFGQHPFCAAADRHAEDKLAHKFVLRVISNGVRIVVVQFIQVGVERVLAPDAASVKQSGHRVHGKLLFGTEQQTEVLKQELFLVGDVVSSWHKIPEAGGAAFDVVTQLSKYGSFVFLIINRFSGNGKVVFEERIALKRVVPALAANGRAAAKHKSGGLRTR